MPHSPTAPRTGLGVMAGAAAVGLVAGLAANMGRKVVMQAAEGLAGDWFDVLKAEHLVVLELMDRLEATDADEKLKRAALFTKVKAALAKHALQEENVVYPALRRAGPEEETRKLVDDHGDMKTLLYTLETTPKDDPQWIVHARELRTVLEAHIREEEDEIFPTLRQALSEDEDAKLTLMMHKEGVKLA